MSLWKKIKARRLDSNVYTLIAFIVLFVITTGLYVLIPDGVPGEIFIAIATSILATIFISIFDLFTAYRNFKNSEFIDSLYNFGIHNLYFNKEEVLRRLIRDADHEIWVSGYRLIMTKNLLCELYEARLRGVNIRFLICPPWTETYKLVYEDEEATLENYFTIMSGLERVSNGEAAGAIEVHFTSKPLFNDTYLVDDKIVTSPYMHNRDLTFGVMSARDFFTYELDDNSKLFQLMKNEYEVVWDQSERRLVSGSESEIVQAIETARKNRQFLDYWEKVDLIVKHTEENPTMIRVGVSNAGHAEQ